MFSFYTQNIPPVWAKNSSIFGKSKALVVGRLGITWAPPLHPPRRKENSGKREITTLIKAQQFQKTLEHTHKYFRMKLFQTSLAGCSGLCYEPERSPGDQHPAVPQPRRSHRGASHLRHPRRPLQRQ